MTTNKVTINLFDNNLATETYMEASGQCGGWFRKPNLVQYIRFEKNWQDGITIFTDNYISWAPRVRSKYKVAWLMEPYEFNRVHYDEIVNYENDYDLILTYVESLHKKNPNKYIWAPPDFTVIEKENQKIHNKTKLCSMVYSNKTFMSGHKLRHDAVSKKTVQSKVDLFGSGTGVALPVKSTAMIPYMFSIAIENSKVNKYFTEKIEDCFVTGTIPIYYGAPDIKDFFNEDGILSFDTVDELEELLLSDKLSESYYNSDKVQKAIKENFQIATEKYSESDDEIYKIICTKLGITI